MVKIKCIKDIYIPQAERNILKGTMFVGLDEGYWISLMEVDESKVNSELARFCVTRKQFHEHFQSLYKEIN